MSKNRDKIIFGTLAVADSIWIYALLAVIGLVIGLEGSPLPWLSLFAFYAAGMFTGWVVMGLRGGTGTLAIMEGVVGFAAVYLLVAGGNFHTERGFDLWWAVKLAGADLEARAAVGAVVSLITGVIVWRRALGIVADDFAGERLKGTFKLGIALTASAVIAEQIVSRDTGIQVLLVPFFASCLAGMAVARLPDRGVGGKDVSWARIIGAAVLVVIGLGLALGLLGGIYGVGGVRLLFRGWGLLVDGLLWVLRIPLELFVNALAAIFNWLKSVFGTEEEPQRQELGGGPPEGIPEAAQSAGDSQLFETIFNIIQYPLLVILIIGIFLVLALAYRRLTSRRRKLVDEDRESIQDDPDAAGDLLRLLSGMLPSWFTKRREETKSWRYPKNEVGIAEAFVLYFDYLAAAMARGMAFIPNLTPSERVSSMEAALPGARVGLVTEIFNAACYGHVAAGRSTIESLRSELAEFRDPAQAG